ncbi:hypothetical protein DKM27_24605 [Mycobacterium tuberculosis variant bovis]|uniref:hypothetical protein n=1 Tax=Mycobacterium avium complex (MAC) TaxID=120793 RepID=UPI00044D724F|nr:MULTISPECIES: hypothetical protein [Mycobacterium avium complex (MAC)]TXA39595.1 hypothetical protein DKM27_24605 [Mycobacterium tuberculosis variant bovis]ETZ58020.1 gp6 domain protein [Mycobacterium sp. MAC_080597_8934]ETZ74822.1 gp6 domain protein [Mycobacterium sp. MAC_011194_8550]ETZ75499.1 gp6 domain protein [Mycobacterium sp. MAC_011194_8550]MBZ4566790.1 hypothetical protein [Mycobacterium avium subsp. hominissuis]
MTAPDPQRQQRIDDAVRRIHTMNDQLAVFYAARAKWATGKGNADKRTVLATVRDWWPATRIANHDQADALVLAAIGAFHAGDPMPFAVKERHSANLAAVQWPELVTR